MTELGTWWSVALVGAALVTAQGVRAETAADRKLEELDQKVRILERKLELADETAAAQAKDSAVLSAGKVGFALAAADKSYQLKLRGYVQTDARFFLDDEDDKAADSFLLRRARPIFEGTVGKAFDFRVMPDFGGGSSSIQDAYAGLTLSPAAKLRVGKFKAPFGLERLQSGTDTLFIERAHPTSLAPNRDIGAQLGGDFANGALGYAIGVFNGVADGGSSDSDTEDGKDLVGRVFAHPFKNGGLEALAGLGVGVAASYGDVEGTPTAANLPSYRSTGQQSAFAYRTSTNAADVAFADGTRTRLAPQAYYYAGPFGVLAEYTRSSQDVARGDRINTIENDAWQVAASYVLTGEDASFKGVTPLKPFDPARGQWGAWEVAARYTALDIDDAAFPDFADPTKSVSAIGTWGVGVNWYLTRNAKFSVDYEQSSFDGGVATGDRPDEKLVFARGQLSF